MRNIAICAAAAAACGLAGTAQAAFIVEALGTASGNYAYTGAGGTAASGPSTGVSAPGTSSAGSIFGGNGTVDEYTYSYTPAVDADNTVFAPGTALNSFWDPDGTDPNDGLFATGLVGGVAGFYNVYTVWPETTNTSSQPTTFVATGDQGDATYVVNQNINSLDTGAGIGLWELIGTIAIEDPSATYTVTQNHDGSPGFVSMRSFGVLWEYAGPIPEPASASLLGLASFGLLRRRR
ncbi:MAG: PEP-CTERM sorting domain-containing protein [Planctomycetota bacterium]